MIDEFHCRKRYHQQLDKRLELERIQIDADQILKRKSLLKKNGELWVSVHFRWGDIGRGSCRVCTIDKNKDPNLPNKRCGLGFKDFCICIKKILDIDPNAKVFFFAEGISEPYRECPVLRRVKVFHELKSTSSWKEDLDIMSRSQLLIGGDSSFLRLAAFLCKRCVVIDSSPKCNGAMSLPEKRMFPNDKIRLAHASCITYLDKVEKQTLLEKIIPNGLSEQEKLSFQGNYIRKGDLECYLHIIQYFMSKMGIYIHK